MVSEFEKNFWNSQYKKGLGSGAGSRGNLLEYKTNYLNKIFKDYNIKSVFDFGCGDGWQVEHLKLENYYGIDISEQAIKLCRQKIPSHWELKVNNFRDVEIPKVDCCMCIDTLYHIMDDETREKTIENIFNSGASIIILYTIHPRFVKNDGEVIGSITMYNIEPLLKEYGKGYNLILTTENQIDSAACFMVFRRKKWKLK